MANLDIEKLLLEISSDEPCGKDLEYDPMFQELESAATSRPAQEFGDTVMPAEEPDWRNVQGMALDLLSRTKDLRIASIYLSQAVISTGGFIGFSEVLSLIEGYLEQYWNTVHPQLDSDDNLDPTSRINAIQSLSDQMTTVNALRNVPLFKAQGIGIFSLRDMDISMGRISIPVDDDNAPPTQAIIEGALKECALDELQGNADAIENSLESIEKIDSILIEKVGVEETPELQEITEELKNAHNVLAKELTRRGVEIIPEIKGTVNSKDKTLSIAEEKSSGGINSRADVVAMLDKICDYYNRSEPSSPVPLLLQRAKRLVSKGFMEIVKDLVPDGVKNAEKIMGVEDKK